MKCQPRAGFGRAAAKPVLALLLFPVEPGIRNAEDNPGQPVPSVHLPLFRLTKHKSATIQIMKKAVEILSSVANTSLP
nr:MAG: hypothetical protein AM324_04010 [Candidatus Thorarchaeota archaeon SMTZ1-83]